jgi:hypothetical protein
VSPRLGDNLQNCRTLAGARNLFGNFLKVPNEVGARVHGSAGGFEKGH